MAYYSRFTAEKLEVLRKELEQKLEVYKSENHNLNMARGKPCIEQLELSGELLEQSLPVQEKSLEDYRNYGALDGIEEAKELFAEIIGNTKEEIIIGGNSSLTLMYDAIAKAMLFGTLDSEKPWCKLDKVKFLCPSPGYDRHFAICEAFGIEMITIDMDEDGPNMDQIESLVATDDSIKGIWCVPKYSNPTGITYSDSVVKRLATMKTAACDFRIFWDIAYIVHDLYDYTKELENILLIAKKVGNGNRPYIFTSMSKVTFAGAAISALSASEANIEYILKQISIQTIGANKVNQYLHVGFLKNKAGIVSHMKKHAEILRPKFETVTRILEERLGNRFIATWNDPRGGYFINLNVLEGCAKEVVAMAESVGLKLTPAGATYPYKMDPKDCNIRIAPSYPPIDELEKAIEILCACIELSSIKKYLEKKNEENLIILKSTI